MSDDTAACGCRGHVESQEDCRFPALRMAFVRIVEALVEDESLHNTDDNGDDVCGEDHDGCECELPRLINETLARSRR